MMTAALRHHIKQPTSILHALARACSEIPKRAALTEVKAPLTKAEERAAAANYWQRIGHDLPAAERTERHRRFASDAPLIRPQRRTSV